MAAFVFSRQTDVHAVELLGQDVANQITFMTPLHDDNENAGLRVVEPRLQHFIPGPQDGFARHVLSTVFMSWASSTTRMSAPKPVRPMNDMARRLPPALLLNSSIWSRSSWH